MINFCIRLLLSSVNLVALHSTKKGSLFPCFPALIHQKFLFSAHNHFTLTKRKGKAPASGIDLYIIDFTFSFDAEAACGYRRAKADGRCDPAALSGQQQNL